MIYLLNKRCLFLFVLIASTASAETLRIGMVGAKQSLHPLKKQSDNGEFILNTLLEPLIALDKKWQWRCFLCSELPTLDNGQVRRLKDKRGTSYLRVSFEIRPDAKWGDGKKSRVKMFVSLGQWDANYQTLPTLQ